MKTRVDREVLPYAEVVLGVKGQIMSAVNLLGVGEVEGSVHLDVLPLDLPVYHGHPFRDEGMPDVFRAELYQVAR